MKISQKILDHPTYGEKSGLSRELSREIGAFHPCFSWLSRESREVLKTFNKLRLKEKNQINIDREEAVGGARLLD